MVMASLLRSQEQEKRPQQPRGLRITMNAPMLCLWIIVLFCPAMALAKVSTATTGVKDTIHRALQTEPEEPEAPVLVRPLGPEEGGDPFPTISPATDTSIFETTTVVTTTSAGGDDTSNMELSATATEPTMSPTVTSMPTPTALDSPVGSPVESVPCECSDVAGQRFFASAEYPSQDCAWLVSEPSWMALLCRPSEPAWFYCAATCGRCNSVMR